MMCVVRVGARRWGFRVSESGPVADVLSYVKRVGGLSGESAFPVVVAEGVPLAGKSRSLYEAMRALPGEWRAVAADAVGVVGLLSDPRFLADGERTVVWVDDVGPGGLVLLGDEGLLDG
jgi:hypothetical protein